MVLSLNCLLTEEKVIVNVIIGMTTKINDVDIEFKDLNIECFTKILPRKEKIKNRGITEMKIWKLNRKVSSKPTPEIKVENCDEMMHPTDDLADYFNEENKKPEKKLIHIIIQPLFQTMMATI
ncbi:hypothetical protein RclHR1_04970009 [Rhizophagus clarus]|uniref:Uncharacterized protein n=1 Tax=Rhizophagus clarus TaxID=94130 RepID=A0A2Z6RXC1_9GLOM|nr:hypothetical protein RclHR1_04970009 [Rhizophagus clarus]GES90285.1 hypothetical protein GLOIN_2v1784308 [Rhizophagus clarus]